jgi:hypothetical protein
MTEVMGLLTLTLGLRRQASGVRNLGSGALERSFGPDADWAQQKPRRKGGYLLN